MTEKQHTISQRQSLKGVGLHTGVQVELTFCPSDINTGITFKRVDIEGQPVIPADVDFVSETARGTTLTKDGVHVSTVEHALAAAAGLQIDNLVIELNGPEVPILDGSAKMFIEAIIAAGIVEQEAEREYYELKTNVFYNDPTRDVEIIGVPSDSFRVKVMIDFNSKVLGFQHAQLNDIKEFASEIAPCRTLFFFMNLKCCSITT